jgi:histidinol phosphatase-like PHP family hydrolase
MLDIHEDYHVHSNYNDHSAADLTVTNALNRAEEIGLKTLAFTEHVRRSSLWIPKYIQEIANIRKRSKTNVVIGFETKILSDGSIDCLEKYSETYLIIASFHTVYLNKKTWLNALLKAIENPHVNIIGHLAPEVTFIIDNREIEYIANQIVQHKKIVEINAKYHRPPKEWILSFKDKGVRFHLGSDAHSLSDIGQFEKVSDLISLID